MYHEGGVPAPGTTSDGSDDDAPDPERGGDDGDGSDNDSDEDGSPDAPMKNWEEFDRDAVYQKKLVDPEMRQWVLTNDCRRIVSDKFFNNPAHDQGICNLSLKKGAKNIAHSTPIRPMLRQLYTERQPDAPLSNNLRHHQLS